MAMYGVATHPLIEELEDQNFTYKWYDLFGFVSLYRIHKAIEFHQEKILQKIRKEKQEQARAETLAIKDLMK